MLACPRRRGEPLVALGVIALGWIAVRAFAWQSPFPPEPAGTEGAADIAAFHRPGQPGPAAREFAATELAITPFPMSPVTESRQRAPTVMADVSGVHELLGNPHPLSRQTLAAVTPPFSDGGGQTVGSTSTNPRYPQHPQAASKRWHVDSWVAWRQGNAAPAAAALPVAALYGASQAGFVARFDLASSTTRPQAYLRALHAPDRGGQSDLALGVGARPLERLPVRVQAEARVTRSPGQTLIRPALLAVTELPPVQLPLRLRGEAYAQAGWVAGRFSTGFVDGQARIDREIAPVGTASIRLGAGAWGGAQKSAARLDVGPTLTLDLRDGPLPARLSLDYRQQVAGNASPGSGLAVTLSTGF